MPRTWPPPAAAAGPSRACGGVVSLRRCRVPLAPALGGFAPQLLAALPLGVRGALLPGRVLGGAVPSGGGPPRRGCGRGWPLRLMGASPRRVSCLAVSSLVLLTVSPQHHQKKKILVLDTYLKAVWLDFLGHHDVASICLHMGVALTGGGRLRGKILDFRGLGGPGRPGNPSRRRGASPPTFLKGLPAARGRQDPPKSKIFILNLAPPRSLKLKNKLRKSARSRL